MSIEQTYFLSPADGTFGEIYNWFTANAGEYFDSFELSEDGSELSCKKDGTAVFKMIAPTSGTWFQVYNKNGVLVSTVNDIGAGASYVRRLTRTSKGIAIAISYGGADCRDSVFITKDNKGNTAFVVFSKNFTTSQSCYAMNISSAVYNGAANSGGGYTPITADHTQLVQIPVSNQGLCYLPDLLFLYASSVGGAECTLSYNNENFWCNGYLALRE